MAKQRARAKGTAGPARQRPRARAMDNSVLLRLEDVRAVAHPERLTPQCAQVLQRACGNRAVTSLLPRRSGWGAVQRHVYVDGDKQKLSDVPPLRRGEAQTYANFFTKSKLGIQATDWDDAFKKMRKYIYKIKIKPGDKLYGLEKSRTKVAAKMDTIAWPTIDRLNNVVEVGFGRRLVRQRVEQLKQLVRDLNRRRTEDEYQQIERTYNAVLVNLNAAYNVGRGATIALSEETRKEYRTLARQAADWGNTLLKHRKTGQDKQGYASNVEYNRPCKAGIINTLKSGKTIHFELSGLRLNDLWDPQNGRAKSVTAAEVWKIFKLWMTRKLWLQTFQPKRLKRIRFYQNGKEVDPPWVTDPAPFRAKLLLRTAEYGGRKRYKAIVGT